MPSEHSLPETRVGRGHRKRGAEGKTPGPTPQSLPLTRQPPGHAEDQQDDRAHQKDSNDRDEPVRPQRYGVCGEWNSMSDVARRPAVPALRSPRLGWHLWPVPWRARDLTHP